MVLNNLIECIGVEKQMKKENIGPMNVKKSKINDCQQIGGFTQIFPFNKRTEEINKKCIIAVMLKKIVFLFLCYDLYFICFVN